MNVKRFWYVRSRKSRTLHMADAEVLTEGSLARCGRPLSKGWLYSSSAKGMASYPRCKQCEGQS